MIASLAWLCLLVALPGLCSRRFGKAWARIAAAVAAVVLFIATLDPPRDVAHEEPARVIVVPTGPAPAEADLAQLGRDADVDVAEGGDPLGVRVAATRLAEAASHRALTIALLWTGPFSAESTPDAPGAATAALTAVPLPRLDPSECAVRALRPGEAGRPAALEVQVAAAHPGLTGRIRIEGPDGTTLLDEALDAQALAAAQPAVVRFEPPAPGMHRTTIELALGEERVVARGSYEVAPARRVLVIGTGADALAAALRVQGCAVETEAELPADLEDVRVVVALDPIAAEAQERLAAFAADGGGVFLVGGASGGALPRSGEPLEPLLPVAVTIPAPADAEDAPGERGEPGSAPPAEAPAEPAESPPAAQPPASPPSTPPPDRPPQTDPPPPEPSAPATGDTSQGRLIEGPEQEVDRRTIAMVLVIDRSRSMMERSLREGVSKMDYAKRSAAATAEVLREGDVIGVVTFGTNGQVVLPLTDATEHEKISRLVAGLVPNSDDTLLADALIKARELLLASRAAVRHIVVISDGEIHDAEVRASSEAVRSARQGITVSLIQIAGSGEVRALHSQRIAQLGGGKFARTDDASQVPRLVGVEVAAALGSIGRAPGGAGSGDTPDPTAQPDPAAPQTARAEDPPPEPDPPPPETPPAEPEPAAAPPESVALEVYALRPSPLLEPATDEFPAVGGILPVEARLTAQVLLLARQGETGVPLLSFANRGLGKIGVWSSDLLGAWGSRWRADAAFPARLAQWVSWLMPPLATGGDLALAQETELIPPAPRAEERAALERLAGQPLRPVAEFVPPPPRTVWSREGSARDLALFGVWALVVLALVEYLVNRGRAARRI